MRDRAALPADHRHACDNTNRLTVENEKSRTPLIAVRSTPRFAVFDDVLAAEDFARLWEYIQLDEYTPAHLVRWEKAWRLADGQPLVGVMLRHVVGGPADAVGKSTDGRTTRSYPTRGGIDAIIGLLLERHDEFAPLICTL